MIGAHLDSWHAATGATDNADGVGDDDGGDADSQGGRRAAAPHDPRRALGRRRGGPARIEGLGRAASRRRRRTKPARDKFSRLPQHRSGHRPDLRLVLHGQGTIRRRPIFDAWLEPFKDLGVRRNVIDRIGNTDHLSFIDAGVPGFNPIQDYAQLRHAHPPHEHGHDGAHEARGRETGLGRSSRRSRMTRRVRVPPAGDSHVRVLRRPEQRVDDGHVRDRVVDRHDDLAAASNGADEAVRLHRDWSTASNSIGRAASPPSWLRRREKRGIDGRRER